MAEQQIATLRVPLPGLVEALARLGLEPTPLLIPHLSPEQIRHEREKWRQRRECAVLLGIEPTLLAGIELACCTIARCRDDAATVADLGPLIGCAGQTVEATIARAELILGVTTAVAPAAVA